MDPWRRFPASTLLPLLLSLFLSPSLSPFPSPSSPGALALEAAPAYLQHLEGWSRLMHQARTDPDPYSNDDALPESSSSSHVAQQLRALLDLTSSEWRDVILKAVTSLSSGSDDVRGTEQEGVGAMMTSQQNVTLEQCLNDTYDVLAGLVAGDTWALQMVDAMGKPTHGLMEGNVNWPGGYTQCLNVTSNASLVSPRFFSGRYCTVYSSPPPPFGTTFIPGLTVILGACIPDSCSSADTTLLLNTVARMLNLSSQISPVAQCQEETRPLDTKAIVAIVICSIIVALMVAGTALDVLFVQRPKWADRQGPSEEYHPHHHHHHHNDTPDDNVVHHSANDPEHQLLLPKPKMTSAAAKPELGVVGKVLLSFSVYTNGSKLLDSSQPPGSLTCVHGVRFLSMTWVVLGHSWATPASAAINLLPYLTQLQTHWAYQGITNATVSVDSFFVLSGLLVTYLTLKEMKKRSGKLNWFLFYFHRFWRLTPAYMLCLMVATCLVPYMGEGPFWPAKSVDEDFCAKNWWTNLLYINNFVNTKEACFGVSWYLANDMQFYILSPLIFVPLFFFPVCGGVVALIFLLATSIVPGVLSQHYGLAPGLFQGVEGQNLNTTMMDYMDIYYFKPYNRMGAYIVGMLAGYFLYRTNCKLRIHWLVNLCLWGVFTACALAVLYGLYETGNGHPVTVPVAAFYNAVARQAWGASLAWVVVACVTGNGGFVNTILSWPALVPLSRLTYCIYLLHMYVLQVYIGNSYSTFYMDDINLVCLFLGILVMSCAVAFVASLAFEAPMMGLERAFLRPKVNSKADPKQP